MSATGETATVTYRGVTATVHVEEHPHIEGRLRIRLSAEPTARNLFLGIDETDLYSVEAKPEES